MAECWLTTARGEFRSPSRSTEQTAICRRIASFRPKLRPRQPRRLQRTRPRRSRLPRSRSDAGLDERPWARFLKGRDSDPGWPTFETSRRRIGDLGFASKAVAPRRFRRSRKTRTYPTPRAQPTRQGDRCRSGGLTLLERNSMASAQITPRSSKKLLQRRCAERPSSREERLLLLSWTGGWPRDAKNGQAKMTCNSGADRLTVEKLVHDCLDVRHECEILNTRSC